MITKITFIYDTSKDPSDFEGDNPDLMAMARAIPGFQKLEASRVLRHRITALLGRTGGHRPRAGTGALPIPPSRQEQQP